MARREFSKSVKRAALARSEGKCEATGAEYGLNSDQRCNAPFVMGIVEFDHVTPDGLTGEPTLENCAVVCPQCHRIKTRLVDVPRIAKAKRRADRATSIRKPSSRQFQRPEGYVYDWSAGRYVREESSR